MLHRLGPWPSPKPDLSNYRPDTAAPEPDPQRFSELRGSKATLRHEPPRSKDSIQIRTLKNEASQSGVEDLSTDGRLSAEAPQHAASPAGSRFKWPGWGWGAQIEAERLRHGPRLFTRK